MLKHTKSKKASNSQLESLTHPATRGRRLFLHRRWSCEGRRDETEAHLLIWIIVAVAAEAQTQPTLLARHAANPQSTLDPDPRARGTFWNRHPSNTTFPLCSAFMFLFWKRLTDALLQVEMDTLIFRNVLVYIWFSCRGFRWRALNCSFSLQYCKSWKKCRNDFSFTMLHLFTELRRMCQFLYLHTEVKVNYL